MDPRRHASPGRVHQGVEIAGMRPTPAEALAKSLARQPGHNFGVKFGARPDGVDSHDRPPDVASGPGARF